MSSLIPSSYIYIYDIKCTDVDYIGGTYYSVSNGYNSKNIDYSKRHHIYMRY